jgi:hypothetical protein
MGPGSRSPGSLVRDDGDGVLRAAIPKFSFHSVTLNCHRPARPGLIGRSSIQETVVRERRGRGVLGPPLSRRTTAANDARPRSRGAICPRFAPTLSLESKEGAGNAGRALHPTGVKFNRRPKTDEFSPYQFTSPSRIVRRTAASTPPHLRQPGDGVVASCVRGRDGRGIAKLT